VNKVRGYPDYRITYDGRTIYTVVHRTTNKTISCHNTVAEARAAAANYQKEDSRRQETKDEISLINALSVTEREYKTALKMARDYIPLQDSQDLWQLRRYYEGQVFYRDDAERGLKLVRKYIKQGGERQ
jgi:hypothetical protein